MAKQIEESFDFSRRRKTHDFQQYADGNVWSLAHGEDYQTTGTTVQMHARQWAEDHDMEFDSKIIPATDHVPECVVLRFVRRSGFQQPEGATE